MTAIANIMCDVRRIDIGELRRALFSRDRPLAGSNRR
jgi:hypothetical protein